MRTLENSLEFKEQYAYRRHHSATRLLRRLRTDLTRAIAFQEKIQSGNRPTMNHKALFLSLDASGAFNAAPIDKIIDKLEALRVPEIAGIHAWLLNRRQRLGDGEWIHTTSGVPQGSVLGPILWILYLDSLLAKTAKQTLPTNGKAHLRGIVAFADDLSLWASGSDLDRVGSGLTSWAKILITQLEEDGIMISRKSRSFVFAGAGARGTDTDALPTVAGFSTEMAPMPLLGGVLDPHLGINSFWEHKLRQIDDNLDSMHTFALAGAHPHTLRSMYFAYVFSHLSYAVTTMTNLGWNARAPAASGLGTGVRGLRRGAYVPNDASAHFPTIMADLELRHSRAARIISGTARTAPTVLCLREAGLLSLEYHLMRIACKEDEITARLDPTHALSPLPVAQEPLSAILSLLGWATRLSRTVSYGANRRDARVLR